MTNSDCASCPLPGGSGYVPGRGNLETAEFFYLGEGPGETEINWKHCTVCSWEGFLGDCPQGHPTELYPSPFVGKAGQLARRMLKNAGIDLKRVYFSNVLRCRPPENKYPTGKLREACEDHCKGALHAELESFAANAASRKVIICAGAQALRAVTGYDDVAARRGSVMLAGEDYTVHPDLGWLPAVVCTLHPSFVLRGFGSRDEESTQKLDYLQVTVADYIKAERIVRTGSLRRPASIWFEPSGAEFGWCPPRPSQGQEEAGPGAARPNGHLTIDLEYRGSTIGLIGCGSGEEIHVVTANESTLGSLAKAIDKAPVLVGHNLITADLPILEANHVIESIEGVLPRVVDTEIVQHLLYPDMESGLDYWGSVVTDLPAWKADDKYGPEYCGRDVYATDQLYERGVTGMESLGLTRCLPVQQQVQCLLYRMSQRGVKIASEKIPEAKSFIQNRLDSLAKELPFKNPNSNPEVHAFFGDYVRRRGGKLTIDKHALVDVISKYGEEPVGQVARLLLEHRELSKIESTYLSPYEEVGGDTIHSRFDVTKQGTGRISSAEPNLFQLPKRLGKAVGDLGKRLVRGLIIPRHPGWLIMEADWSQIELRLVALFADAKELNRLLAAGVDIHGEYAKRFGQERDMTKIGIHGGNYKASPYEIARNFDAPVALIEPIMKQYQDSNPEIRVWWEQVVKDIVAANGILRLPFGRIRRFSGKVADWEKSAISTGPQGTGADMLLRCLIELEHETLNHFQARILFPCHDAVIYEYPPEEEKRLVELNRDIMEKSWPELNGFRNPIELKRGPSWAEVKTF
jgi:uracil-DNA glycosylase family 4